MSTFQDELKKALKGEVYFDSTTRSVYSVDASIFEIRPMGVAIPKNQEDLQRIVEIAAIYKIPITVRGAATGITGGCLGDGIVIDLSKYLTRILEVNIAESFVICEPGVVQDDLNRRLSSAGYRLGPDTSTGNRATIGGMLANNAAGSRSLRFGQMADHVLEVDLLLSTGQTITFSSCKGEEWKKNLQKTNQEGDIYRTIEEIRTKYGDEIRKYYPKIPRRVSGYNLDRLLSPFPLQLSSLIAGSEGTLGIATQIKMHIVPNLQSTCLLLFLYDDMLSPFRDVSQLLECFPISLELIDHQIIALGRQSPSMRNKMNWLTEYPQAILCMEVEQSDAEQVRQKSLNCGYAQYVIVEPEKMGEILELRKAGLGLLLSKRSYSRAVAFIEDIAFPPEKLAEGMEQVLAILSAHRKEAGIYGHVGAGCMHIRPYINLRDPHELHEMKQIMEEIALLLLNIGGALSGEHGDGWIRSWLNPKIFGVSLLAAFQKLKNSFDPSGLMNPGKIIPTAEKWDELRERPAMDLQSPSTFLDFTPEGGFELAADLCNGNGLCRKKEGTMCPSYQATHDELHSTRARAQVLRSIIQKRLPLESFTDQGMFDVMDLCLSCKGCKTECPSQVDMAKFKSEFLYQYQTKHGFSFRNRLFGNIGTIQSFLSPFASWVNSSSQWPLMKSVFRWIGISTERALPTLANEKFSTWFSVYLQHSKLLKTVVLLNDTFTEFNHPEVGKAAVVLLNSIGYRVVLADWNCCGRPALSKGLLPQARKQSEQLIRSLERYAKNGYPLIGLEPSCLLTVRDDYLSLLPSSLHPLIKQISLLSMTLDEFLAQCDFPTDRFKEEKREVFLHGHCYQKAIIGMQPTLQVLHKIPGFIVQEIPSGCCGMAGSFGYEKEHVEISMRIGELVLFPAVRAISKGGCVVASGTSCREQIQEGTQRRALHLAEALASHLRVSK